MEDKEQIILDMVKDIKFIECKCDCEDCEFDKLHTWYDQLYNCYDVKIANGLYDLGYRKINDIVLTDEDAIEFLELFLQCCITNGWKEVTKLSISALKERIAAKKIHENAADS